MAEVFVKAFNAVDGAGVVYEVREYQNMIDTSNMSGTSQIGGLKAYYLDNGTPLNVNGDVFINIKTGAQLTRK